MDFYLNPFLIRQEYTLVSFQDSFRGMHCEDPEVTMGRKISPYAVGSATCSCMKHPKPERFVVTLGMPITVHSAAGEWTKSELQTRSQSSHVRGGERSCMPGCSDLYSHLHPWHKKIFETPCGVWLTSSHTDRWEFKAWGVVVAWPLPRTGALGKAGTRSRTSSPRALAGTRCSLLSEPSQLVPVWFCSVPRLGLCFATLVGRVCVRIQPGSLLL